MINKHWVNNFSGLNDKFSNDHFFHLYSHGLDEKLKSKERKMKFYFFLKAISEKTREPLLDIVEHLLSKLYFFSSLMKIKDGYYCFYSKYENDLKAFHKELLKIKKTKSIDT